MISNGTNGNSTNDLIQNKGCIIEPSHCIPNGFYSNEIFIQLRNKYLKNSVKSPIASKFVVGSFIKEILSKLTGSNTIYLVCIKRFYINIIVIDFD